MAAMPADIPLTIPELTPIVATALLPLVQVPPPVALLKAVVAPVHNVVVPVINPGIGLTVTVFSAEQPLGSV